MRQTKWAVAALVVGAVVAQCAGLALARDGRKGAEPSVALVPPSDPSGWYTSAEFNNAVHAAEILGRPIVFLYQDKSSTCPKHNGQRETWMRARELTGLVRVNVDMKDQDAPEMVGKFRTEAGDKAGKFIPMLFLGTASGEYLGVVAYEMPHQQFMTALGGAAKTFGAVLPPNTMIELHGKLEQARAHWAEGNTNAALKCYRAIKKHEGANPKLSLFVEFQKDKEQINTKGAEEVAAAQALFEHGNTIEGRKAVTEICKHYAGFQVAEDARALRTSGSRRSGAADREMAVAPPAAEPAAVLVAEQAGKQENDARPATAEPPEQRPEEPTFRTWTDSTGKHKVEGKLVQVKEGNVMLKRADGKRFTVPLRRLSEGDQEFIQRWLNERDH